jgi:succinoglycan biosynthesis protein ExoV
MRLYYYRGRQPNFGDELNTWLWPRALPDLFDDDGSQLFLGIGSILFDYHPAQAEKIVFGAGYGGYTPPPRIDRRWNIYFVRGPLTCDVLKIDRGRAITDAAILLARYYQSEGVAKKHEVSFMPHWESALYGNWASAAAEAGIHYIDPTASVETVLADLAGSSLVVTEAMHGAIAADTMRVPWIPVLPQVADHQYKWHDWAQSLEIDLSGKPLQSSSFTEVARAALANRPRWRGRVEKLHRFAKHLGRGRFVRNAANSLRSLAKERPQLSRDAIFHDRLSRAAEQVERLKKERMKTP